MKRALLTAVALFAPGVGVAGAAWAAGAGDAATTIDDFATVAAWESAPASGVALAVSGQDGALRLDFDFQGHGGYAVARRKVDLALPANYAITFRMRGDAPVNTLEFKLVDPSGENVWWVRRPDVNFPREWTAVRYKKRHVTFAWGPKGGGDPERIASLEFVITAGKGGKGTVFFDDLQIVTLPPDRPYDGTPKVTRKDGTTTVDFGRLREFGGLVIEDAPAAYAIEFSDDLKSWTSAAKVDGGDGGRDYAFLPDSETRAVRVRDLAGKSAARAIEVRPLAFGASKNAFFAAIAKDAAPGLYPRYFNPEQPYWTVVGVDGDPVDSLLDTDGAVEPFAGGFRIEPFLEDGAQLLGWRESRQTRQALADGYVPIPSVTRDHGDLQLEVEALATGTPGASTLFLRYRVTNRGAAAKSPALYLALRPFQVNSPVQFLAVTGGVASIGRIARHGESPQVEVDDRRVVALTAPSSFGAATFAAGDIVESIARGALPASNAVTDPFGHASAALGFDLTLAPGATREVIVAVPLHGGALGLAGEPSAWYAAERTRALREWHGKLDQVRFWLPPEADRLVRTMRSNLAYTLINRNGPGIQPGTRSYAKSWIRDGSLTSSALMRAGIFEPAREFIEWFATFQYADGKVPCCADGRGADPVPENDSHGQFIFAVAEYWRLTGDAAFARRMWPHVRRAAEYMDGLRRTRRTPEFTEGEKARFFGLLPESISHEGYSAKPMHSYWDDFFGIVGFEDAAELAAALGETADAQRFAAWRDEFRNDVHASIRATIAAHRIDYIPGCAELGDFDATSTTVGLSPGREIARLPRAELLATFDRFYRQVVARRSGTWQTYTPYELRGIGALVRLGRVDRAHELLDDYFRDQRPPAWNSWSEAIHNPPTTLAMIGDMPHTWVGSDFIRSFLDMFEYEEGDTLRIGCGLPASWLKSPEGVTVQGIRTRYGTLDLAMQETPAGLRVAIGGLRVPPGGVVVCGKGRETVVRTLPTSIVIGEEHGR